MTEAAIATPLTPFERLGGHATMAAIADRFYTLIETDPAYAQVRAMHGPDLTPIKASLASFLAGWSGGPRDWFTQRPGRCMMSIHAAYAISPVAARQWAEAMDRTITDIAPPDGQLADTMRQLLSDMALAMGR
ncbi:MAG: globin [Sphingomonadales bacterium]|nr:globin [Sphingomonadales bacterium]MDE2170022.1 globin [Sphingomonadales bacterium]